MSHNFKVFRRGFFLGLLFLWGVFAALGQAVPDPRAYADSLLALRPAFVNLSFKANVDPGDLADVGNLKAHFRIRVDSVIWVSVNSVGGIEVARALLTPDSIHVIERIENQVWEGNYELLKQLLGFQASFADIQAILLNRLFLYSGMGPRPDLSVSEAGAAGFEWTVLPSDGQKDLFGQSLWLKPSEFRPHRIRLFEKERSRALIIKYEGTVPVEGDFLPQSLSFRLESPGLTENFSMEVLKASVEKELNFPFRVPKRFLNDDRK